MQLIWQNSNHPAHKFTTEEASGYCATCGVQITQGVACDTLAGDAFSRQSEFLAHGTHVCEACAWLYSFPKDTHRNVLAAGNQVWWPMISLDSATSERPAWYQILSVIIHYPADTPCIGVLTTDPKPRLWPLTQQRTIGDFGLYIHCPDYDISEFRRFSLQECLTTCDLLIQCLSLGFSKQACWHGLFSDLKKMNKIGMQKVVGLEARLREVRHTNHFLPSLLVAGIKKGVGNTDKTGKEENFLEIPELVLKSIYAVPIQETVKSVKFEPIPEVTLDTTRTSRLPSAQQKSLF